MFPSKVLSAALTTQVTVELRNGSTYTGTLLNKDNFMNMNLQDVVMTDPDHTTQHTVPTVFIRGAQIRFIQLSNEAVEKSITEFEQNVPESVKNYQPHHNQSSNDQNRDRGQQPRSNQYNNNKGNYHNKDAPRQSNNNNNSRQFSNTTTTTATNKNNQQQNRGQGGNRGGRQ